MAFSPKNRKRYHDIHARQAKIDALASENTPEARQAQRSMNDTQVPGGRSSLGAAWNPNGKRPAKGSSVKCNRINKTLRTKGTI